MKRLGGGAIHHPLSRGMDGKGLVIYCPGWIRDSSKDIFIEEFRLLFF